MNIYNETSKDQNRTIDVTTYCITNKQTILNSSNEKIKEVKTGIKININCE